MVIVEGSCIVVRKEAILENYLGGMAQFLFDIPDNNTLSQDDYLISIELSNIITTSCDDNSNNI